MQDKLLEKMEEMMVLIAEEQENKIEDAGLKSIVLDLKDLSNKVKNVFETKDKYSEDDFHNFVGASAIYVAAMDNKLQQQMLEDLKEFTDKENEDE